VENRVHGFLEPFDMQRGGASRKVEREFTRSSRITKWLELARLKTTSSRTGFSTNGKVMR